MHLKNYNDLSTTPPTTYFTANLPYPNLLCSVIFICDFDSSKSTAIRAATYDPSNSVPY